MRKRTAREWIRGVLGLVIVIASIGGTTFATLTFLPMLSLLSLDIRLGVSAVVGLTSPWVGTYVLVRLIES